MEIKSKKEYLGGSFIIDNQLDHEFFISEEKDEEQKMIVEMVKSFVEGEVWPVADRLEKLEDGLAPALMEKMGELGLLGSHMPDQYGGLDLDFNTNTLIGEGIGPAGAFSVSYNAHTGIGMLPILYFGTEEQKEKYLPKLASGEWKACYCLTEPSSGSDALAAKSKAVLSEDGKSYILNGQKMWISNAGFADVFTVFAQIDGDKFTGFILEKGMKGLSLGEEEKKMGIKGSSTRLVFMENVNVPIENVLGEVGKGHLIAFNVLNTGRFKLAASCLGGAKQVIETSIRYANEREQFNKPISSFGAIQQKIAQQVLQTFVMDSAVYRCSDLINDRIAHLKKEGENYAESKLKAAEEYALECSILKIIGSEILDFVVDEAVQIHGGMGYSEEGTVSRAYRDSRINRIFEGTNEINRLVIINTLFKKAMKGQLDIATPAMKVQSELMNGSLSHLENRGELDQEFNTCLSHKKLLQMVLGSVGKETMEGKMDLRNEQELLMEMADMVIQVFSLESMLLRIEKLLKTNQYDREVLISMAKLYTYQVNQEMTRISYDAFGMFVSEDLMPMYVKASRALTKYPIQNIRDLGRAIAKVSIQENRYLFQ